MSEGELLQIEKARKLDIEEPIYFEIIRKKTASLIASCCAGGSHSVGASADRIEAMRRFGELVGIAFQIKDDLFDYGTADIGKPTGSDIKEKKMHKSGGIKYAETKMHELKDQAIQLLRTFPESAAREALENLVLYTVNRKK